MKDNFYRAFDFMLAAEGGFVNNPALDPGGMTNLGVTRSVWEAWLGRKVTEDEMRELKRTDVMPMYRRKYWDECRCDALPSGLDAAVFDFAVNSGIRRAAIELQEVLGVARDGIIGPRTVDAALVQHPHEVINELCDARLNFLRGLNTWVTFGAGWSRRVDKVRAWALHMV